MKRVAPSPTTGSKDSIQRPGPHMIVANSKPVRHAVTGSAFVIRMLA